MWQQQPVCSCRSEVNFTGQPFLLYFVAVVASASVLGRTAGFVAVAETSIASLLFYDPAYSLKVTHTVDLLAIEIYAVVAALSVEAFCRLVDSALAEKSAAISAQGLSSRSRGPTRIDAQQ
jgi:K+-sensing histidine kinase KdpD